MKNKYEESPTNDRNGEFYCRDCCEFRKMRDAAERWKYKLICKGCDKINEAVKKMRQLAGNVK
jgi:hypothetical protein